MQNIKPGITVSAFTVSGPLRQRFLSTSISLALTSSGATNLALANTTLPPFSAVPNHGGSSGWAQAPALVHLSGGYAANGSTAVLVLHPVHPSINAVANGALKASFLKGGQSQSNQTQPIQTAASGAGSALDLTSADAVFQAGSLAGFHSITLDIGGKQERISFATDLTAAELVAAQQVIAGGKQQLVIGSNGVATGGTLVLSNTAIGALDQAVGGVITGLDIAHGVVAVDTLSSLTLSGNLTNSGVIEAGEAMGAKGPSVDTITAANINNQTGGVIESATGIKGVGSADLSLSTAGNLVNNGLISASQSLSITAGSITNAPTSTTASAAEAPQLGVVKAGADISLNTGNLTNSGLVSSTTGNVNISSGGGNININATGGTVSAASGNININSAVAAASGNVSITGGNWLSQQLNFNSGVGTVNANLNVVSGVVNGAAGVAHLTADTPDLLLGNISTSADPTYYNAATSGNITIDGSIAATSGNDLAIVASGNIIGNGGKLDTSSTSANGGNLTLIAGASFQSPTSGSGLPDTGNTTITLQNNASSTGNGSTTGGYIDLSGTTLTGSKTNQPVTINTSSSTGTGGGVLMVAYAGATGTATANSGSIVATPTVAQNKGVSSIDVSGASDSQAGALTIIGGGSSISMQNINLGKTTGDSSITVLASTPSIQGGTLTILNGTVTGSYNLSTPPSTGAVSVGSLSAGAVTLSTGGTISQAKGTTITANDTTLTAANIGTTKVPFLTNTASDLTVDGNSASGAIYISDANTGTLGLAGVSSVSGQSISITSTAATLNVGNLNFTNVTLVDNGTKSTPGNIVIDTTSAASTQVGEFYAPTNPSALGTGVISITASGSITEGTTISSTQPVIVGSTVVLNSSAANIGAFGAPNQPLTIVGATLTANALKGNVLIDDLVQTTLNAGSAGTSGTFAYDVTGNGLAVAGPINANIIDLAAGAGTLSGGPGTVLDINASIGSSKTLQTTLSGSNGILQTNSKAIVTSQQITLADPTSGDIGAASAPISTKASATMEVDGYSSGTGGVNAFVSQSGAVTLVSNGNATAGQGSLNMVDSGTLTIGPAQTTPFNFGNISITAPAIAIGGSATVSATSLALITPTVTVATGGSLSAANASFESTAAISVSGAGTITVGSSLAFQSPSGGQAASVTLGSSKTGTGNPLTGDFGGTLSSLEVSSKGAFTLDTTNGIAVGGAGARNIAIVASNIVDSNSSSSSSPIDIAAGTGGTSNNVVLNITGTQAVTLGTAIVGKGSLFELSGVNVDLSSKGALTVSQALDGNNLQIIAASLTVGSAGSVQASDLLVAAPTVIATGTIAATNSSVFTANGNLSITGTAGNITPGSNVTIGSYTLAGVTPVIFTTKAISLGSATSGANDPLSTALGNASIDNLTVSATGNLSSAAGAYVLAPASPGTLSITAADIVDSKSSTASIQFTVNGTGVAPGSIAITLTGSQATTLGTAAGNYTLSATSDQTSGGGTITVMTKGNLTATDGALNTANNATFSLTSTGGTLVWNSQTMPVVVNMGTNTSASLSGAKGLSINDNTFLGDTVIQGVNSYLTALTLTSGSTTEFTIDASGKALANGTSLGLGGTNAIDNSSLNTLSIYTGGGIFMTPSAFITMPTVSTLTLSSTGLEAITGTDLSITPGSNVSIYGKTGITLGTPNGDGTANPLNALFGNDGGSNVVNFLSIETPGKFTCATDEIVLGGPGAASPQFAPANVHPLVSGDYFGLQFGCAIFFGYFGPSPNSFLNFIFGGFSPFVVPALSGPNPLVSATATANINIDITGKENIVLGGNPSATTTSFGLNLGPNVSASLSVQTAGNLTVVGGGFGAGIATMGGSTSLTSGGNLVVNTGGITLGTNSTALSLSSSKSLAVYDTDLLNGTEGPLTSVLLSSAGSGSFVVGASGSTFANGTAGSIIAPSVTILTPSLTNAMAGGIQGSGVGSGSSLTLGATGKSGFTFVTGTGTFGAGDTTGFDSLSIIAAGNINLGNLFTSSSLLGDATSAITIGGPGATQSGTLTFGSTLSTLSVIPISSADSTNGNGGSIDIAAKSIVAASGITFEASQFQSPGTVAGSVSITTAAPITTGTGKGDIQVSVGGTSGGGTVALESTAGVLTIGTVGINTGAGSLSGLSVAFDSSVSAGTTLSVQATASGGKGIITATGGTITASQSLSLLQTSTKLSSTGLDTSTADLELAQGAFNINNSNPTSNPTLINATSTSPIAALTLTNKGAASTLTEVGSITTTAGGVSITDTTTSGTLEVASGSSIQTNSGSILLDSTVGSIDIQSSATMHASGTASGVGQITIVTGAVPLASSLIAGTTPTPASTSPTMIQTVGGDVTYSVAGDTAGTITVSSGGNVLSALQRNIVFNEGAPGSSITLSGQDMITADPPSTSMPAGTSAVASAGLISTSPLSASAAMSPGASAYLSSGISPPSYGSVAQMPVPEASSQKTAFVPPSSLIPMVGLTGIGNNPVILSLDGPAESVVSKTSFEAETVKTDVNSNVPMSLTSSGILIGEVTNADSTFMGKGAKLLAPTADTIVQTDFGKVKVAANAVVLITSFDGGLAVYNLHDGRTGAVSLVSGERRIVIRPGRSLMVTSRKVTYFEQINPAHCVSYKDMQAIVDGNGLRSFSADFDILSLLRGFEPLRQFVSSSDVNSRRAAGAVLKTAAILQSLSAGGSDYHPMVLPEQMAMRPH